MVVSRWKKFEFGTTLILLQTAGKDCIGSTHSTQNDRGISSTFKQQIATYRNRLLGCHTGWAVGMGETQPKTLCLFVEPLNTGYADHDQATRFHPSPEIYSWFGEVAMCCRIAKEAKLTIVDEDSWRQLQWEKMCVFRGLSTRCLLWHNIMRCVSVACSWRSWLVTCYHPKDQEKGTFTPGCRSAAKQQKIPQALWDMGWHVQRHGPDVTDRLKMWGLAVAQ